MTHAYKMGVIPCSRYCCWVSGPIWLFAIPWTAAFQASPVLHHLLEFYSNSGPLNQWCHPPIISFSFIPFTSCPSVFPNIRVFSNELALCITWPKYWSFSFSICPANEYSGLVSFRIDLFDLLQGTAMKIERDWISEAPSTWKTTNNSHHSLLHTTLSPTAALCVTRPQTSWRPFIYFFLRFF